MTGLGVGGVFVRIPCNGICLGINGWSMRCLCISRDPFALKSENTNILGLCKDFLPSPCQFLAARCVRHWARKSAFEKQRRLPNRRLRAGNCAASLPPLTSDCRSNSSRGPRAYSYLGDFSLRQTTGGWFCLSPPFPSHRNITLQQQQQLHQQGPKRRRHAQLYKNIEYRDIISLLPKPWGLEGPWGMESHRIFHKRNRKPLNVPIARHDTANPKP